MLHYLSRFCFVLFLSFTYQPSWAQELVLPELEIPSQKSHVSYQIETNQLNAHQSYQLSRALEEQKGVTVGSSCGFCGSKQLSLLGHRPEHTTILVDGLSLHSTVSNFYGLDFIPLLGSEHVDIFLTPAQAQWIPESIGGAINISTTEINYSQSDLYTMLNQRGDYQLGFLNRSRKEKWGFLLGGEVTVTQGWDQDQNRIWEYPTQSFGHFISKVQWQPTEQQQHHVRLSYHFARNRGGHRDAEELDSPPNPLPEANDFNEQDISQSYLGLPNQIYDSTRLLRWELALTGEWRFSPRWRLKYGLGGSRLQQNSIYAHGYDYRSDIGIINGFIQQRIKMNATDELMIGGDAKQEVLLSSSDILYNSLNLTPDHFSYQNRGLFISYHHFWEKVNLASDLSVRYVHLKNEWPHFSRQVTTERLIPRLFLSQEMNNHWFHSFGYGIGYRMPLTIFESQHGTNHYGMEVAINDIETSQQFQYQIGYRTRDFVIRMSGYRSTIHHMSYGVDRAIDGLPTLFVNSADASTLDALVLDGNWIISPRWESSIVAESYWLPDSYTQKMPVALIEQRLRWQVIHFRGRFQYQVSATGIGARNLTRYGRYSTHFQRIKVYDLLDPNYEPPQGIKAKWENAPAFVTWDFHLRYSVTAALEAECSITNLFDYTQTKTGDSPLTWHMHGDHYHLDNFHLWGPLRGREVWLRLKYQF